jgi:hypothetical protein
LALAVTRAGAAAARPLRVFVTVGSNIPLAWIYRRSAPNGILRGLVIRKELIDLGKVKDFNELKGLTLVASPFARINLLIVPGRRRESSG